MNFHQKCQSVSQSVSRSVSQSVRPSVQMKTIQYSLIITVKLCKEIYGAQ